MPVKTKTDENEDANHAKCEAHQHAQLPRRPLRAHRGRQSPLAQKIPDAHAEMERRSQNSDHEKCKIQGILQILRYAGVRGPALREKPLGVEMPSDIHEGD